MTCMIFLGMAATDIYIPSLPQMTLDFATTPDIMNLTLSCYTGGIAIGVLFIGELSNRYGRRKVLISSVFGFALTSIIIASFHFIYLVILCRIVQALCAASTVVVSRLVIKDCLDQEEQLKANGILLMGLVISPAIAPIIGAYLAKHFGWQSSFIALAIMSLILTYGTIKWIPETNTNLLLKFPQLKYYLKTYWQLLNNPVYVRTALITSFCNGAYFTFIGISSYLFILDWNFTPEHYSSLYLLMAGSYLLGNFALQILNRKQFSLNKIIKHGVFVSVLGGICMLISPIFPLTVTILLIILGTILMRLATALINPATQIKIINKFSNYPSQAIGLSFFLSFGSNSIAISGVSLFSSHPLLGLILVSNIFVLGVILCYWYNARINE